MCSTTIDRLCSTYCYWSSCMTGMIRLLPKCMTCFVQFSAIGSSMIAQPLQFCFYLVAVNIFVLLAWTDWMIHHEFLYLWSICSTTLDRPACMNIWTPEMCAIGGSMAGGCNWCPISVVTCLHEDGASIVPWSWFCFCLITFSSTIGRLVYISVPDILVLMWHVGRTSVYWFSTSVYWFLSLSVMQFQTMPGFWVWIEQGNSIPIPECVLNLSVHELATDHNIGKYVCSMVLFWHNLAMVRPWGGVAGYRNSLQNDMRTDNWFCVFSVFDTERRAVSLFFSSLPIQDNQTANAETNSTASPNSSLNELWHNFHKHPQTK